MAHIHTYQAGFCTHPECMVIKGGRMQICQFPAYVFLLQVGDKLWLWDTGYAEHFFDATTGIYQLYRRITPVSFDPKDAIINQLASDGIAVSDLSGVILSHFHADHIAGIKDFVRPDTNQSTTLIVSLDGWQKVKPLKGIKALTDGFLPKLIPSQIDKHLQFIEQFEQTALPAELAPFDTGYVLPESHSEIILVELAGHAHGHFGAFVQTEEGWTLIASDSAWLPENYQKNIMPSVMAHTIMSDVKQYKHTLLKLHTFYHARPDVPILLSHS